jgi:methionine synthase II (cobalamin-independent)
MEVSDINYNINQIEDAKTLKAVMFLMIQEHVKSIPNDQELGARIRKIVNKFNKDNENN